MLNSVKNTIVVVSTNSIHFYGKLTKLYFNHHQICTLSVLLYAVFVTISGHSEESLKAKAERRCDAVKNTPVRPIDGSTLLQDLPFNLVYRMLDHGLPTNNWRGFAANLHSKYIPVLLITPRHPTAPQDTPRHPTAPNFK